MSGTVEVPRYEFRGAERWRDPWDEYRRLRDDAPVHRHVDDRHGEFWVLSRFDDVCDAARDTATFSSARGLTPDPDSMAMFEGRAAPLVMMDPPEHTAMRRRVSRPMTPRAVAAVEPDIRAFVDARLDEVAESVKQGVYEAGGIPLNLPVVSLGETQVRPTAMLWRNMAAMAADSVAPAPANEPEMRCQGSCRTTPLASNKVLET